MKHVCTCSVRALEIFVRDVTGVAVRQHRRSPLITHHTTCYPPLTIGPNPSISRRFASTTTPSPKSDAVPFDRRGVGTGSLQSGAQKDKSIRAEDEVNDTSEDYFRDDWHAEIKIAEPWQDNPANLPVDAVGVEVQEPVKQDTVGQDFVDDAVAPVLQEQCEPQKEAPQVPLLPLSPDQTDTSATVSSAEMSPAPAGNRVQSRLQRKLRRIESGTYKRTEEKTIPKEEIVETQAKSILSFMKASRGISEGTEDAHEKHQRASKEKGVRDGSTPGKDSALKREIPGSKKGKGKDARESVKGSVSKSPVVLAEDSISEPLGDQPKREREQWQIQKNALTDKFGDLGWQPRKRLSPDTLEGIRALHTSDPSSYTTPILAEHFKISPEAIRRILRSKWRPKEDEADERRKRWERRGERKWQAMAAQGVRPPARWRAKGIRTPQAERKRNARRVGDGHVRRGGSVGPSLAS